MSAEAFARYLSQLDAHDLTRLIAARPDVRLGPAPRGFTQLAQRLSGAGSIVTALRTLTSDMLVVGQAVAVLRDGATVPAVARLLAATAPEVEQEVARLCAIGLAWTEDGVPRLPDRLREHWTAEIGGEWPAAEMAARVPVDDLRAAATAWGVRADNLRKAELGSRLAEAMADPRAVAERIESLPARARAHLERLCLDGFGVVFGFGDPRRGDPAGPLVDAGLVLRPDRQPAVPREVAIGLWLAVHRPRLTGRPRIARAATTTEAVRTAAQAAAREAVRALSTLLDEAGRAPVAALKKGGIGTRERSRLARRLSIPQDVLVLWIDLAYAAGLLAEVDGGYAPTRAYSRWRAAEPSRQWADVATAWYLLAHAPLMREVDEDKEHPPPLPLMSAAGEMRRAVLRAASGGLSLRGASAEVDWFAPLHGYPPDARDEKVAAALREAELLGIAAADRLTEFGEALTAAFDTADDVVADVVRRCAELLPDTGCTVILQSDLTAVVSGRPSAAVSDLLAAAAVNEARGEAAIWRFTPASVRSALDAGWTAERLLTELTAVAGRDLPQPLAYLITDAERRHGHVRVRATRSCVVADEALVAEILATRGLTRLGLTRLAPTVLSSPTEPGAVLAGLRAAGLAPVAEDSSGTVVVERRQEHLADADQDDERPRSLVGREELARRLLADPDGDRAAPLSTTARVLARLNPRLDDAELALLAHAADHRDDVVISYIDKNGSHTVRQIRPSRLVDRWLHSFCYLRGADREFAVDAIEAVAPAP